jgi:hypothetical protein
MPSRVDRDAAGNVLISYLLDHWLCMFNHCSCVLKPHAFLASAAALCPQIMPNFRARELIPLQEAEAFAKSRGGRFPAPQYCPGLVYSLEGVVTGDGEGNRGSVADAPAGPAGSGPGLQQQVQQLAQGASGPYRACGVVLMVRIESRVVRACSRASAPPVSAFAAHQVSASHQHT